MGESAKQDWQQVAKDLAEVFQTGLSGAAAFQNLKAMLGDGWANPAPAAAPPTAPPIPKIVHVPATATRAEIEAIRREYDAGHYEAQAGDYEAEVARQRARPSFTALDEQVPVDTPEDDLLEQAVAWQKSYNKRFQQQLEHDVTVYDKVTGAPYKGTKPIAIAFPSDWHIGNRGTDHARIIEDTQRIIGHPRLYAALGGDPVDNFILEKMISASREQLFQVDVQWVLYRSLVRKLVGNHSLLYVGAGNHDAWTYKVAGIDGIQASLAGIKVVNTGEGGYVRLRLGGETYGIYRKHKPTRFNSGYNPHHFLEQMLRMGTPWDFDIGVSEHFHHAHIKWGDGTDGTKKERVFITTGSYKVEDAYAYQVGYYGGGYGVPCVVLFPDRREMWPVARIEQAVRILDSY